MKKVKEYQNNSDPIEHLVNEPFTAYGYQPFKLINLVRLGVVKKAVIQLANTFSLTLQEIGRILHISERTLQRYDDEDVLSTEVSERAVLLSRLCTKGVEVLNNPSNFSDWLKTPLPAFGQAAPILFLDTTLGIQLVQTELNRIEHGIF